MKIMIQEILDVPMRQIIDSVGNGNVIDILKDSNAQYKNGNYYITIPGGSFHFYEVDILEIPKKYYNEFVHAFITHPEYKDSSIVNPFDVDDITDYEIMVAKNLKEFEKMKEIIVDQSLYAFSHSKYT